MEESEEVESQTILHPDVFIPIENLTENFEVMESSAKWEEDNVSDNTSDGWSELAKSDYAKVIFCDLYHNASAKVVGCKFQITDNVHEDPSDCIGLFRVGHDNLEQCLASKSLSETACEEDGKLLRCIFSYDELPSIEHGFYQFLYVTRDKEICGASMPFEIKQIFGRKGPAIIDEVVAEKTTEDFLLVQLGLERWNEVLEDSNRELKTEKATVEAELKEAQKQHLMSEKRCETLEIMIDNTNEMYNDVKKELEDNLKLSKEQEDMIANLKIKLKELNSTHLNEISVLNNKLHNLQEQFDTVVVLQTKSYHENTNLSRDINYLKDVIVEKDLALTSYISPTVRDEENQKLIKSLMESKQVVTDQYEDAKFMITALEESKQLAMKEMKELSESLNQRTKIVNTLKFDHNLIQKKLKEVSSDYIKLTDNFSALEIEKQSLKEENDKLKKELDRFEANKNHLEEKSKQSDIAEHDKRFDAIQDKLMRQIKFDDIVQRKVNMSKIDLDAVKPWVANRTTEIHGEPNNLVVEFIFQQLEEEKFPDARMIQMRLMTSLGRTISREFMTDLWKLLVSAERNADAIPAAIREQKEDEIKKRRFKDDFKAFEIEKQSLKEENDKLRNKLSRLDADKMFLKEKSDQMKKYIWDMKCLTLALQVEDGKIRDESLIPRLFKKIDDLCDVQESEQPSLERKELRNKKIQCTCEMTTPTTSEVSAHSECQNAAVETPSAEGFIQTKEKKESDLLELVMSFPEQYMHNFHCQLNTEERALISRLDFRELKKPEESADGENHQDLACDIFYHRNLDIKKNLHSLDRIAAQMTIHLQNDLEHKIISEDVVFKHISIPGFCGVVGNSYQKYCKFQYVLEELCQKDLQLLEASDKVRDLECKCNQIEEEMLDLRVLCTDLKAELTEADTTISSLKEEVLKKIGVIEHFTKQKELFLLREAEFQRKQMCFNGELEERTARLKNAAEIYQQQYLQIKKLKKIYKKLKKSRFDTKRYLEGQMNRKYEPMRPTFEDGSTSDSACGSTSGLSTDLSIIKNISDSDTGEHVSASTSSKQLFAAYDTNPVLDLSVPNPSTSSHPEDQNKSGELKNLAAGSNKEFVDAYAEMNNIFMYYNTTVILEENRPLLFQSNIKYGEKMFSSPCPCDTLEEAEELTAALIAEEIKNSTSFYTFSSSASTKKMEKSVVEQQCHYIPLIPATVPDEAEGNLSSSDEAEYAEAKEDIFIPCTVCEEMICVSADNYIPLLKHGEQVHQLQMCPVCGQFFESNIPQKYFLMHIEKHFKPE